MRIMDIMNDTKFRPGDFDNSRYHCINCFNRKEKPPVLILMSNSSNPPHWMVIDGLKQMVYFKHGEAMYYCKQMGYV